MFPDLDSAFSINASSDVINTLAELYIHQRGNPHVAYDIANRGKSPNQTIQDLLDMFREDNTIPRGLIMRTELIFLNIRQQFYNIANHPCMA